MSTLIVIHEISTVENLHCKNVTVICSVHTLSGRPGGYPDDDFINKFLKIVYLYMHVNRHKYMHTSNRENILNNELCKVA